MKLNKIRMYMKMNGLLIMVLVAQNSFSQTFELPDIPKYDSIFVDSYEDKIKEKTYFLEGERVFEIGYNTGSVFYTPFATLGAAKKIPVMHILTDHIMTNMTFIIFQRII